MRKRGTYICSSPFGGLSDIGSLGVVGPEHEGQPWISDDPYVQVALQPPPPKHQTIIWPEEPQSPPSPDFIPEPVYPEFMPPEDEILLAEEQPLPAADSPTTDLLGYIPESDPEEDPKEDDNEDLEEDPADYPADEGDDGDDEDEPSDDDEDEEVDIEADGEEEEEHPTLADSTTVALPAVDQAPSVEETEPFETDESAATPPPHPAYRVTARISIRDETPISLPPREEVERLLVMPTPYHHHFPLWVISIPQTFSPHTPEKLYHTSITTTTSDFLTTTTNIITSEKLWLHYFIPLPFNLLSDQEYSEDEEAKAMAETMEQYMSKTRTDYESGVARPKIDSNNQFELKGQFLTQLQENTFSSSNNEDANERIEKVLKIVDLFHVPNITIDQLMLRVFSISLTGAASRWLRNKPTGSIKTWEDLKTKFLKKYCPPGRTAKKIEEINNFQQEPDETLYQAWERVGNSELLLLVLIYYYWFRVDAAAKD
ncbi:hypothetical protein Tco_0544942 [Tanacetum coccineum]